MNSVPSDIRSDAFKAQSQYELPISVSLSHLLSAALTIQNEPWYVLPRSQIVSGDLTKRRQWLPLLSRGYS